MKRIFKIGVIVLILGVILLGIGFFNNGNKAVYFENNRPAIFHSHTKTISTNKAFERIDISASTANVIVREGKKYQITYSGISRHTPAVTVHNNVASIRQTGGFPLVFNFNDYQPHQDLIIVTIPLKLRWTILMLTVAQARLNTVKLHYAEEVQNSRQVTSQDMI